MAAFEALYLQDPYWLWVGVACLFVALSLAAGSSVLMWPGVAALVVAAVGALGVRAGLVAETAAFGAICGIMAALEHLRRTVDQPHGAASPVRAPAPPRLRASAAELRQPARLVGRIGRASSEFINGVGRVWIDGAEWAAELQVGEELSPSGVPVRVVKVIGGVRLQVLPIEAG